MGFVTLNSLNMCVIHFQSFHERGQNMLCWATKCNVQLRCWTGGDWNHNIAKWPPLPSLPGRTKLLVPCLTLTLKPSDMICTLWFWAIQIKFDLIWQRKVQWCMHSTYEGCQPVWFKLSLWINVFWHELHQEQTQKCLTDAYLKDSLTFALSSYTPDYNTLVNSMQCQSSH